MKPILSHTRHPLRWILVALVFLALVLLFLPYRISTDERSVAVGAELPASRCSADFKFGVMSTASAHSLEAMTVQGGSLVTPRQIMHPAVLVRHPRGTFLFDTGLGVQAEEQFEEMTAWLKPLMAFENLNPARDQLQQAGIKPVDIDFLVLSHMHWDHASGIKDFPGVPVRALASEVDFALSSEAGPPGFIPSQYDGNVNWQRIELTGPAYAGFPKSLDLFGDGCVVLVELPGHTHGSLGMFLNQAPDRRFLFSGDLTWTKLGVTLPAEKFFVSRWLVDTFPERINKTILQLHALLQKNPTLNLVPSHDAEAYRDLPVFPDMR